MTQVLGNAYPTTIATLSDEATIVDAFKYYHQGGLTNSPAPNSIEQHFINVNGRVDTVNTYLGYASASPIPVLSVQARLTSLENAVETTLASDYIKSAPASNDTASTRNRISPTLSTVVPLTIQGVLGQTADLQKWRNSAEVSVARVDKDGKIYSNNGLTGTNTDEVVTLSGSQPLTNKTLTNPIQTVGTNTRTSSGTFALIDQSKIVEVNSSSSVTLTVPADINVNFPIGTYIVVLRIGTGSVTIDGQIAVPSSVIINATPGRILRDQWSMATLIKRAENRWVLAGDLIA